MKNCTKNGMKIQVIDLEHMGARNKAEVSEGK